jgi:hypothetical protein
VREPESPTLHGAGDQLGTGDHGGGKGRAHAWIGDFRGTTMVETPLGGGGHREQIRTKGSVGWIKKEKRE